MPSDLPPILFINTDQLRADFLSCYGFPVETSPNIDRFAAEGAIFRQAFTQSPICVPARYSLTSGQFPTNHGAFTNGHRPYPATRSLLTALEEAGYHTACIGKLHHNPPDSAFGWAEIHLHDGTFPNRRRFSIYSRYLQEHGQDEDELCYPTDIDEVEEKRRLKDRTHWGECRLPDEYTESTFLGNYCVDWIESYDREAPPFLYLSFLAPHSPYSPPAPYHEMFDPADMPAPPRETDEQLDAKFEATARRAREDYGADGLPDGTMREIRAQYAGLIRHMDAAIGSAVEAFRGKFGEDAMIMLTSDHGDLLGEHHACEKHQMYEAAVRVPWIVCWPGRVPAGTEHDGLVQQVDMFPTALGLAGGEWRRWNLAGKDRSAGLLAGAVAGEEYVFSENHDVPYCFYTAMARSRTGKLVLYLDRDESREPVYEYYDLAADPHELENVVADPAHAEAVHAHRAALCRWLTATRRWIPPAR